MVDGESSGGCALHSAVLSSRPILRSAAIYQYYLFVNSSRSGVSGVLPVAPFPTDRPTDRPKGGEKRREEKRREETNGSAVSRTCGSAAAPPRICTHTDNRSIIIIMCVCGRL
eukprot:GHVU01031996.1.p2 GENE.GHVU01031996.1~~GHVU01031996.1.p2  ORF type:complete len:113 (-),score=13.22 GHVU01031996.1:27-365(-)